MAVSESRDMVGPPLVTGMLVGIAVVFFAIGYFLIGTCDGGWSLVLFGIGVFVLGIVATPPWQVLIGAGIFGTALLVIGVLALNGSGCITI
jgi:hypothetical protein